MSSSIQLPRHPHIITKEREYFRCYKQWAIQQNPRLYISPWRKDRGFIVTVKRRGSGIEISKTFTEVNYSDPLAAAQAFRDGLPEELFVRYDNGRFKLPGVTKVTGDRTGFKARSLSKGNEFEVYCSTFEYSDPYAAAVKALFDHLAVEYPVTLFDGLSRSPTRGEQYLNENPMAYISVYRDKQGDEVGLLVVFKKRNHQKTTRTYPFVDYADQALPEARRFRDAVYGLSDEKPDAVIIDQYVRYIVPELY
ncbi:hypothetical protein [Endozoicomonas atrinae]|uniref:hypothetical protein n=1 Tax=Endozoicomonas atrinae TaxID=1333660 RepID=UPI000B1DA196|nr:hypothetical protein [Endozoicomonas atrinae]